MHKLGLLLNSKYLLVIVAAGALLALPALLYGIPFYSDDGIVHAIYYSRFSQQLWSGDIYPRWLFGMNCGFGSPTFYFYPPLPYYLTSLIKPLFASDAYGLRQLGLSATVALISSGVFSWLWLSQITSRRAALLASVLYMLMPYHLAYDLYARAAFAEFWVFAWMPLILYFTYAVARSQKHSMPCLALVFAALMFTHLLTTLIFSPIPLCYAACLAPAEKRWTTTGKTALAMTIGAGLSAIFWLPSITTGNFIHLDFITADSIYSRWFLFGLGKGSSLRYVWFALEVSTLVLVAFLVCRLKCLGDQKRQAKLWAIVAAWSLFMMTPLSKPIWILVFPLQMLQFPWRFNTLLTLAATPLLALAFDRLQQPLISRDRLLIILVVLFSIHWAQYTFARAWSAYPALSPDQESTARRFKQLQEGPEVPQFQVRSAQSGGTSAVPALLQEMQKQCDASGKTTIIGGRGEVAIERWTWKEMDLRINNSVPSQVVVSQFYYPGWVAQLRDEQVELTVVASKPHGLVSIIVPAGNHIIVLRRQPIPQERAGQAISAVALLSLLLLSIWQLMRHGRSVSPTGS